MRPQNKGCGKVAGLGGSWWRKEARARYASAEGFAAANCREGRSEGVLLMRNPKG
jgi:hypothetical protein